MNELRRAAIDAARCQAWVRGVLAARADWTDDFGGEQFSLGRAFYTHFEEDRTRAYFADAAASDARVEQALPGLQREMRRLGLRVWDVLWNGDDVATNAELDASSVVHAYGVGDLVALDSYRLHQIQPFGGAHARISATVHAAELDSGRWETWF